MRKRLIGVLLILALCAAHAGCAEQDRDMLSAEALQQRLNSSPYINLLDVREEADYAEAHIPYASSLPLTELEAYMRQVLDSGFSYMETEIIVYGDSEEAGAQAADILRSLGFTNVWRLSSLDIWTDKLLSMEDEMRLLGGLDTVDIYGNPMDASLLQGYKLTMVNVWATYCRPCVSEMSDLGRLAADVRDMGVQVVGLVSDVVGAEFTANETQLAKARSIVEQTQADYPQLLPSKDLYWRVIGQIEAVPTTFFVDETGMLVGGAYVGSRSYAAWMEIVEEMLGQTED